MRHLDLSLLYTLYLSISRNIETYREIHKDTEREADKEIDIDRQI